MKSFILIMVVEEFTQEGYINKKHIMSKKRDEAHKAAWQYFFPKGNGSAMITIDPLTGKEIKWELHHVDETLKKNNKERYYEWRIEDLIMIPSSEHHRLHSIGKAYCKGKHLSKEHKEKLSKAFSGEKNPFYGKKHSDELIKQIASKNKGRHHTEEAKQKMSEARKGVKFTDEHKNKIAKALKSHTGWHHWTNGIISVCSVECPRRRVGSWYINKTSRERQSCIWKALVEQWC